MDDSLRVFVVSVPARRLPDSTYVTQPDFLPPDQTAVLLSTKYVLVGLSSDDPPPAASSFPSPTPPGSACTR